MSDVESGEGIILDIGEGEGLTTMLGVQYRKDIVRCWRGVEG